MTLNYKKNMLSVSDFFCGCGGLSQGFREAGLILLKLVFFNSPYIN
jgi:site-specific DNA-cytosine methylase